MEKVKGQTWGICIGETLNQTKVYMSLLGGTTETNPALSLCRWEDSGLARGIDYLEVTASPW